ncbi:hypothetical protein [Clostridium vitabionis]|jgi:hypothetical protein|uniref:hypothetical protein n=1 Tax=Clostridium vitabionis TaxID=2784388 RepID=UPI00188D0035|nr:hypothetical protein [Clostridium vitabionis]
MIQVETEDERRRREEEQKIFSERLAYYQRHGIVIRIDGQVCQPRDYSRLFVREGRSFYMGDYIGDEDGKLCEIHFDRVYYR